MGHDMIIGPLPSGDLLDRPGECRTKGLPAQRSTGFVDGHQPMERPLLPTALLQLAHEQAVRQHDQVHVPGLAPDVTQPTVAQPELLLAVPMDGLRARPAKSLRPR